MMGAMEDRKALREYARQMERTVGGGGATERTHYPTLKTLLESLEKGVTATVEPKRIDCGAPDFRVSRGQTTVGYVEAKDVGASLDAIERDSERAKPRTHDGDQLKRFRKSLPNLVLTDYLEWRWYVDGARRAAERLGTVADGGKIAFDKRGAERVWRLMGDFYAQKMPSAGTPKELSERMSRLARMIRDATEAAFEQEAEGGTLHGQLAAFRETLLPDLMTKDFADMYAQTIAYGLFAARTMWNGSATFTRQNAAWLLPKTNPFLRSLFSHIAGPDLDDRIAWVVDDLAQLLAEADMAAVLQDFGRRTKKEDPVVHFYETFLKEYDPEMREMRGVYYTPEPVVSYIVRSVDCLLRERFGRPLGLADPNTLVLDPVAGTGTFLYAGMKLINETLAAQGQLGSWSDYVARYLLPRLLGFELLMAPYAIAHLKLGLLLQELGYTFQGDQRLGVYLTNTLEDTFKQPELTLGKFILEEADAAAEIKKVKPIMVVLGNPPYSRHSANKGAWVGNLVRDYYQVDGRPLGERNPKWLQNDYVKFLRFGQWRIERTGQGILAFITSHGYVDDPTFRGMRHNLMKSFTDIYVLDLHGNKNKQERAPDGGPDENVFDIRQGVAIGIFVKEPRRSGPARVHHASLWGERATKYHWLQEASVRTTEWARVNIQQDSRLFVPQDTGLLPEYGRGWAVSDIFPVSASTVTTARNDFALAHEREVLLKRINDLGDASRSDEWLRAAYGLRDVSYWSLKSARRELEGLKDADRYVRRYCYRPFDFRFVLYHHAICERLRPEVMGHMQAGNIAFLTHRPHSSASDFTFAYCTRLIGDQCVAANKSVGGGNSYQFPLYLYPSQEGEPNRQAHMAVMSPWPAGKDGRHPNISPDFIAELERGIGLAFVPDGSGDLKGTFGPEDVFHYIYAVLHSPSYRERYADFLKREFARVPLTSDKSLFAALAVKGSELVLLHVMESPALGQVVAKFTASGSNEVEKVRYSDAEKRVYINKTQYFEGVEPEVWEFCVGGYQVCEKWLKDRKGHELSYNDVAHYQKIVVAIKETIQLMGEIDAVIPGWPIE